MCLIKNQTISDSVNEIPQIKLVEQEQCFAVVLIIAVWDKGALSSTNI